MRRYPVEICDTCEAEADAHWLTDRLQYCPHNKAIAWRGDPAAPWNIHRKAKPAHFAKALGIALATFEQHCKKTGVSTAEGDRRLTLLHQLMRAKEGVSMKPSCPPAYGKNSGS